MIDWVSAKIICNHDPNKLFNGAVLSLNSNLEKNGFVIRKKQLRVLIQQNSDSVNNRYSYLHFRQSN